MGSWPSGLLQSFIDRNQAKLPISQRHMDLVIVVECVLVSVCGGGGVFCIAHVCVDFFFPSLFLYIPDIGDAGLMPQRVFASD